MLNYLWFIYTIGKPGGTIFIYIILTDTYRCASVFVYVYVYPPLVSALIAVYSAETDVNVREFPEDFIQRISY